GLAPEDRGEIALDDLATLVARRAVTDALHQGAVLFHVRVHPGELLVLPGLRALDRVVGIGAPAGALERLAHLARGAGLLAAHRHHAAAIGVLELHGEVIEDVPVERIGARLAPSHGERADGMATHHPVGDVNIVDVLLDDVIARGPGVVEPVAQLEFGVGPLGEARIAPEPALVPIHLPGDDIADRAVVNPADRLLIARVVAALRAGDDRQSL